MKFQGQSAIQFNIAHKDSPGTMPRIAISQVHLYKMGSYVALSGCQGALVHMEKKGPSRKGKIEAASASWT